MLSKSIFTALAVAGILVCSAGCGTSHNASAIDQGTHTRTRFLSSSKAAIGHFGESAWAKSFMKLVPADAVGYPAFGLIVAPLSSSSSVSAQAGSSALASFKQLLVAQAVLGKLLVTQTPDVAVRTVTDYIPSIPSIRKGSSFPAVVITYPHVTGCNLYGGPKFKRPRTQTCTTMGVLDLQNGKWLDLYQF